MLIATVEWTGSICKLAKIDVISLHYIDDLKILCTGLFVASQEVIFFYGFHLEFGEKNNLSEVFKSVYPVGHELFPQSSPGGDAVQQLVLECPAPKNPYTGLFTKQHKLVWASEGLIKRAGLITCLCHPSFTVASTFLQTCLVNSRR